MKILIMGTRGIPAGHGGFEACVENLAPFLATEGLEVFVFRQVENQADVIKKYKNVSLINIIVSNTRTVGTVLFDIKSVVHAILNFNKNDLVLSFGYPTAFLFPILKLFGFRNIVNMDGIEWKRRQFGAIGKLWYWVNEKIAVLTADHLIGDHAKIVEHLQKINWMKRPIHEIAYSADDIRNTVVPREEIGIQLGEVIEGQEFALIMARLEPDNQILEIVRSFSQTRRSFILCVAGRFDPLGYRYHRNLMECASDQVFFLGGVYKEAEKVFLRNHAIAYLHGHTVGGTNPSLVEALGSNSPIIAHRNDFNLGVTADGALYFDGEDDLRKLFDNLPKHELRLSRERANSVFVKYQHDSINTKYLKVIKFLAS